MTQPNPEHAYLRSGLPIVISGVPVRPLGVTSFRLLRATKNPMSENAQIDIGSNDGLDAAIGYLYIHAGPENEVIDAALNPDPAVFQKAALKFSLPLNLDAMLEILKVIMTSGSDTAAGMVEPKSTGESPDPNGPSQPG